MGFQSEIEINFFDKSCFGNGYNIIGLIDSFMEYGWDVGVDQKLYLLDKGNDFNFITVNKNLSGLHQMFELLKYKELKREFIKVDLEIKNLDKSIELIIDPEKEFVVKVTLLKGTGHLKLFNPIKFMDSYLLSVYKPLFNFGGIINIKYISGHDYEIVKEFNGQDLFQQIEMLFTNS